LLNNNETATLNIICRVTALGVINNTASLVLNDSYTNNLNNSSSVDFIVTDPQPPKPYY